MAKHTTLLEFDELFRFLESYSEYHIDDIVIDNDGEETDAQMIARLLPELKKVSVTLKSKSQSMKTSYRIIAMRHPS